MVWIRQNLEIYTKSMHHLLQQAKVKRLLNDA